MASALARCPPPVSDIKTSILFLALPLLWPAARSLQVMWTELLLMQHADSCLPLTWSELLLVQRF